MSRRSYRAGHNNFRGLGGGSSGQNKKILFHVSSHFMLFPTLLDKPGNPVARDLPPTGSEAK